MKQKTVGLSKTAQSGFRFDSHHPLEQISLWGNKSNQIKSKSNSIGPRRCIPELKRRRRNRSISGQLSKHSSTFKPSNTLTKTVTRKEQDTSKAILSIAWNGQKNAGNYTSKILNNPSPGNGATQTSHLLRTPAVS